MKKIYLCVLTLVFVVGVARADVLLDYGFDGGEAPEVSFYDCDGLTPSFFMRSLGFRAGKAWIPLLDSTASTDYFYGSTSQYSPAGQADDWMVMPAVTVQQTGYILSWESQSFYLDKCDGLKVFISTEGPDPEMFPAEPVWQVEEEEAGETENFEGEFVKHVLSLDDYVGQTIYIAFVNQSYDKGIIAIDNIWAGREIVVTLNEVSRVTDTDAFAPTGVIENRSGVALENVTLSLAYGNECIVEPLSDVVIGSGESYDFVLQHAIPLERNEPVEYTLKVEADGFDPVIVASSVVRTYNRCVVIEDHTGLWCGNCPSGIWAIDTLMHMYPDNLAPVAVHNNSGLAIDEYDAALSSVGLTAFPVGWINRTYISSPWGSGEYNFDAPDSWVSLFDTCMTQLPEAGVDVVAYLSEDETKVWATASIESAQGQSNVDWRVIYVLTEDSVTGYYQRNYYAGTSHYVGGWESLPASAGVPLNDIARGIYPSFRGEQGSLPSQIEAQKEYKCFYEIVLPESIMRTEKLKVIAMLVDGTTGRVVNADIVPVVDAPSSVEGVHSDSFDVCVVVGEGEIVTTCGDGSRIAVELFTIEGRKMDSSTGNRRVVVSTGTYSGIVLLRVTDGRHVRVCKLSVR